MPRRAWTTPTQHPFTVDQLRKAHAEGSDDYLTVSPHDLLTHSHNNTSFGMNEPLPGYQY